MLSDHVGGFVLGGIKKAITKLYLDICTLCEVIFGA